MSEKTNRINQNILELLEQARAAMEQQAADEARGAYLENAAEFHETTLQNMFAQSVSDLKNQMFKKQSSLKQHEAKHLRKRADNIASQNPSISKHAARQVLRRVQKNPTMSGIIANRTWKLYTPSLHVVEPHGLAGEEVSQSWFIELDASPGPPEKSTRMTTYLSVRTGGRAQEPVPIYQIAMRTTDEGAAELSVLEDGRELEGDELFAPYGFILEASRQYPPLK